VKRAGLEVLDLTVRRGKFVLDGVSLEVEEGGCLAILGPSGAGKTTLIEAIAGLVKPASGRIMLDGRDITDLPPERRGVGYLPQDYALFPHLTVRGNIESGPRARGESPREARRRAEELAEMLGIAHLLDRRVSGLSGGERQRVALARALAVRPSLLLLDEPLSALDAQIRRSLRGELRRLIRSLGITTVVVTHDPVDALTLGEKLAIMEGGRIVQVGRGEELLLRPKNRFIADLVGVNFYEGEVEGESPEGLKAVRVGEARLFVVGDVEGRVLVSFAPSEVTLLGEEAPSSARNVFKCKVTEVVLLGERVRVGLEGPLPMVAEVSYSAAKELGLEEGREVFALVKATAIKVYT